MEALEEKLNRIFSTRLAMGESHLETLPNGHVCGHVISSQFEGMDYGERRKILNSMLEQELNAGDLSQVSTLLTYTPQEYAIPLESN